MTILQLHKDFKKNFYRLLYGAAFCLVTATIWITKNQIKIDTLQDKIKEQEAIIKNYDKLIAQHEFLVMSHDYRLDRLDNLSTKTKK